MIEGLLVENIWLILGLWILIYFSDYYLTIIGATLYHKHGKKHLDYEGSYELTPEFQEDIDNLKLFSPRFFKAAIVTSILISSIWLITISLMATPGIFLFAYGGLILRETAVIMRHIRGNYLFLQMRKGGIEGKINQARWLTLKVSSVDLFNFTGLFTLTFLITGSLFFLGGAVFCLYTATQHRIMAMKKLESIKPIST